MWLSLPATCSLRQGFHLHQGAPLLGIHKVFFALVFGAINDEFVRFGIRREEAVQRVRVGHVAERLVEARLEALDLRPRQVVVAEVLETPFSTKQRDLLLVLAAAVVLLDCIIILPLQLLHLALLNVVVNLPVQGFLRAHARLI